MPEAASEAREQRGTRHFLRRHHAAERIMRRHAAQKIGRFFQPMIPCRRSHRTGTHDIRPHAVRAALDRDRLRVGDEPRLGGGISGIAVMRKRVDRGDEDDCAAAAPRHRLDHGRRDVERAGQIDRDFPLPDCAIDLRQCFAAGEAGIADENVWASARAFESRNGVLRGVRVSQIESEALGEFEPVHRAFLEIGADRRSRRPNGTRERAPGQCRRPRP